MAIAAFALVTLLYSLMGGLHASLRNDLFQMLIFLGVLLLLVIMALGNEQLALTQLFFAA
ncbi:MAG: hypothetical protein R3E95_04195 [Thiolinea sp.]